MHLINKIWAFLKSNTTGIISVCALLISLLAFCSDQHHDKLSVRPLLDYNSHFLAPSNIESVFQSSYDGRTILRPDDKIHSYRFEIKNFGTGPALINDFEIFFDGKPIPKNIIGRTTIADIIENNLRGIDAQLQTEVLTKDQVLASNIIHPLIIITFPFSDSNKNRILELNSRFGFKISYRSLYEDNFEFEYGKIE